MSNENEYVVKPIHDMCLAINEVREGDKRLGDALHLMSMLIAEMYHRLNDPQNTPQVPSPPQPVATLCEVVDGLLRDDHFWAGYKEDSVRLYHALTAERKRAELVEEAFREYKAGHVTNCACRACEALRALDAFDKGAENG